MHVPTQLLNSAGIVPDPSSNTNPVADFWFNHIQANFAWTGSVYPAPNPVQVAQSLPHPVSVQQISRFQVPQG